MTDRAQGPETEAAITREGHQLQERQVWVVWTNSDLTEGRGYEFAKHYCETEATARRLARGSYVQGTDGPITTERMFFHRGAWYAPGPQVIPPTHEDRALEEQLAAERQRRELRDQALARAKALGLSEEDIAALSG